MRMPLKLVVTGMVSAVIMLTAVALAGAESQKGPEFNLKLSAIAPEGTTWSDIGYKMAEEVYKNSNGRLKITWYFGGVMGDEPDTVRKMRLGQLTGGVLTVLGMEKIAPEIKILSIPNLFKDYDEIDYTLKKMFPAFNKMLEAKGFELLGWTEIGFAYFFSIKKIQNMNDISKTMVWQWAGEPMQAEIFKLQGFTNTVPLAMTDVNQALQTKMVETVYAPMYACLALQWYTNAKYINMNPVAYTPGGVVGDKRVMDKMPKDLRDILKAASDKYIPMLNPIIRQDNQKAFEGMKKYGLIPLYLTEKDLAEVDELAQKVYKVFLEKKFFSRELFDEVKGTVNEYRSKHPALAAQPPAPATPSPKK
jgi:TRAP-type C4-dicarboxylate transport system substrate-binding protein